jgi:hypothetical protein
VPINSALPGFEHVVVVVLLCLDAALVFKLSKLGSALLVHNLLQVTAHCAVALANLSKDVSLVALLSKASFDHLILVGAVLALNLAFHIVALVLLHPVGLLLLNLVKMYFVLAGRVNILEQVNAGLVLTVPLLFAQLPLFRILFLHKSVDHLFVCELISGGFSSELL